MSDRTMYWLKIMMWVCAVAWIAIGAMSWSGVADAQEEHERIEVAKGPTCMAHAQKIYMMSEEQGLTREQIEANFDTWLDNVGRQGLPTPTYEATVKGMIRMLGTPDYFQIAYTYCLQNL